MTSKKEKFFSLSPKSIKHKLFIALFLMSFLPILLTVYLFVDYAEIDVKSTIIVIVLILLVLLITLLGYLFSTRLIEILFNVLSEIHSTSVGEVTEFDEEALQNVTNSYEYLSSRMHQNMMELENYARQMEQLNRKINEKVEVLESLHNLSKAILTTYDVSAILELVVEKACLFLNSSCAFILLWNRKGDVIKTSEYKVDGGKIGKIKNLITPKIFQTVGKETGIITPAQLNPYVELKEMGMENGTISPIKIRERIIGALVLGEKENQEDYTRPDIELIRLFCDLTTISVHNAKLYKRLELQANTDGLTNVWNYRYFKMRIAEEMERAKRYERYLSLVIIDVDHFKEFNDQYGHQKGDMVLKGVTKVLRATKRTSDVLARYGGDEFVVILPETDKEGAKSLVERSVENLQKVKFPFLNNDKVTISAGLATFPNDADTEKQLLEIADKALYKAKGAGRNQFFYY